MKVGKRIVVTGLPNEKAQYLQMDMLNWRSFSQYTDVEAMLCILGNKELKANCLRNVDDLKEQTYLQPLIDNDEPLPFVACFDHNSIENIPLWIMYTSHSYGVKLQFNLKPDCKDLCRALLDISKPVKACRPKYDPVLFEQNMKERKDYKYPKVYAHISVSPVIYDNALQNHLFQLPAINLINMSTVASVKSEDWSFQNEARIVAFFAHIDDNASNESINNITPVNIPSFEYLLLPIRFGELESIEITFSPWMGEETKRMVREKIDGFKLDCKYIFRDSDFTGTIRIK